jgi:hypothetical protein
MIHENLVKAFKDDEVFDQSIELLLNEFSIEKVKIEVYDEIHDGYVVTKTGIEKYDLKEERDSLVNNPNYIPAPESQLLTAARQVMKEESVPTKESKRRRIIIYVGISIIVVSAIVILITQLLPAQLPPPSGNSTINAFINLIIKNLYDIF